MNKPKVLLLDGDGVIWIDNTPIKGAVESLKKIYLLGIRLVLVTNNSSKTREQYLEFLHKIGLIEFKLDDIFSSGYATALYLKKNGFNSVYVSGSDSLVQEINKCGINATTLLTQKEPYQVDAVVVSKSDKFSHDDLSRGILLCKKYNAKLIGTNADPNFPMNHNVLVCGSGAILGCFETATSLKPIIIGKPHFPMFETVLTSLGVTKDDVIMVGDRTITDIAFASNQGARSILVLSGVDTEKDVEILSENEKPTFILPSLIEVYELLK